MAGRIEWHASALPSEAAVFRDIGEAEAWVTPTRGGAGGPAAHAP